MRSNSALAPMLAGFPDGPKNRLCAVLSPAIQPCLDETSTLKPEAIDDIVLCKNSAMSSNGCVASCKSALQQVHEVVQGRIDYDALHPMCQNHREGVAYVSSSAACRMRTSRSSVSSSWCMS